MAVLLCCAADLFVLRAAWTGRQVSEGQFRHGYFERFGGETGLALDTVIRPLFPQFLITDHGALGVPPGVTAVAPLADGIDYRLDTESALAPYVVIGTEGALVPGPLDNPLLPGEARLVAARTLALHDGRLALVAWDPTRPWRDDAARLTALRAACDAPAPAPLTIGAAGGHVTIHLGRCAVDESLVVSPASPPLLAALAGPDWTSVARQPGWATDRLFVWPVVGAVILRVASSWWGLGLPSTAALSALLLGASFGWPVAAALTWVLALAAGVIAAVARAIVLALRSLPPPWRVPAIVVAVVLAGGAAVPQFRQAPPEAPTIMRIHHDTSQPDTCALVGYSTVQGASLRRGRGGIRWFFDGECARCRNQTAAVAAGGETLNWLHGAFCSTPPQFAADGQVIFFGGANDDFLWGVASLARLFVLGQQGIAPWRRNQASAAAASLARIDAQVEALGRLIQCARSRGADFLFLHDFLVSDMMSGRDPDRIAMLARRKAVVEAAGGRFVDLLEVFGDEAGIAWFNDYVHPSVVAHQRIAELACRTAPGRP